MGLSIEKGVGASLGAAGRTGGAGATAGVAGRMGGLLLHWCAHCCLVNGNESNMRRHSSGHRSLLLAFVGALGEVGGLGNSNGGGGGFFVPG